MIRNDIDEKFLYFYKAGLTTDAYKFFGSKPIKENNKIIGTEFILYAPNASKVCLIGSWNDFKENELLMTNINNLGIWYLKIDKNLIGSEYKYVITTHSGEKLYKADPYAYYSSLRPKTNSIVYDLDGYVWQDLDWKLNHKKTYEEPLNIYELHFGSWKRKSEKENDYYNYEELATLLIPYLKKHHFTHVEILPIYEHPLDASWGYQGTGYYSITSRYGTPHQLMKFIDLLHQANIGVIFDWVPGHVCKDAHGIYNFDGSYLYDYNNEADRENYEWGTANLDLGKGLTRSFLYSNALFYMRNYHVDGFRVDAVNNIIYYLGNKNRGVNTGACDFLRNLSINLFKEDDRVLLIAEDSSDYPGVTKPVDMDGLGFNYKWDMGWMNDTLKYFELDPIYRSYHHNLMTFSMAYFYNEQFLLPFSHDEVVHGKKTILDKMPGDYWQKFANYRLLMGYMYTHPGKKLSFMGNELAMFSEWDEKKELDWVLMQYPQHIGANQYIRDLNKIYTKEKAMYELDYSFAGFKWIEVDNNQESLFIYARLAKRKSNHLIVILNCTPNTYFDYRIGVLGNTAYKEILNSDCLKYGGSNKINENLIAVENIKAHGLKKSVKLTIPPLGIVILKPCKLK